VSRRVALIQLAVSLLALGAVIWWATQQDPPSIPDSPADAGWILVAVGLYAAATAARAERWRRILGDSEVRVSRAEAYSLTTVGYMGNNVLPARAGEVLRVVLLSRDTGDSKRKVAGTIVAERLLDAVVLALVFVVVVYGVLTSSALPTERPLLVGGAGVALLLVAAAAAYLVRRHPVLVRVRDFLRPVAQAPRALLRPEGLRLLGVTALIWALEAAVYLACGHAVGLGLSAMESLYLVALTNFFAALPAAPGSIGTFDAAVVFGMNAIGAGAMAVSYMLLLRLVLYGPITLVGLVVLLTRYGGWSRVAGPRKRWKAEAAGIVPHA
jgi:glycosyltransferase 2 family protein